MKEFDMETLSKFNGHGGQPLYIAHQGKVFDVSNSKLWKTGLHMQRHQGGNDLTADIEAAPHGPEMLERFPQVGILKREETKVGRPPAFFAKLLERYPILQRHPHPMIVHFPIVFMMSVPLFNILYLISHIQSFEITALHCLGVGILSLPLGILTGLLTWKFNYSAKPMRPVQMKIRFSIILLIASVGAFIWRVSIYDILHDFSGWGILYFLLILSLAVFVGFIGWYGGQLTFPIAKKNGSH
jgi:predicted heme/steroid binding protein/uncharacterized membrane protein